MLHKNPARRLSCGVFFGLLLASLSCWADNNQAQPFATRDQNPLVLIYGLPLPSPARLPEADHPQLGTLFNISNTLIAEQNNNTELLMDAETSQLDLVYDIRLNSRWALRAVLPFISHSPGYFDDWIDNFHQALGLREGLRPLYAQDQLDIRLIHQGNILLNINERQHGVGDLMLQTGYQLQQDTDNAQSVWLSIKLPSGDSEKLTGSGHTDIALWLATQHVNSRGTSSVFAQLGGLYMSDSDVLPELHQQRVWFGNAGWAYAWNDWLQLKVQLDGHSAFYNSDLTFLGHAVQLTFGGQMKINPDNFLDIAMSEDIQLAASPDVTLTIGWVKQF